MSTTHHHDLEKGDGPRQVAFEDAKTAPPPIINGIQGIPGAPSQAQGGIPATINITPSDFNGNPNRPIANPGPLGLFSFASTTFILSLINIQTRGINTPNVVVGMAIFGGGLAQLLAGMWEFAAGNTFGATAFSSYGAFWLSYAAILLPATGIASAYGDDKTELDNAIGIYLIAWFMFTFLMLLGALRKSWAMIILLSCLTITFILLAAANFTASLSTQKAGGVMGAITAFVAYYMALAEMLTRRDAYFMLPLGEVPKRLD
ncbi:hypothetical protein GLOTRDRAFT_69736 [Gloeophyllum trabeum ATCC 11539]|uniref:FUN34 transmembrane protein n=1 Tax=Gloeophyllum trabeum (strain ATCC 11539 / FP-39264 / Madison 617) TaxID=670483 RepID=S7S1M0_GLOTA|nr:uncharacterized protein GLOTRDRAFT_69736 [Gloeophyllum trabeum ATCC 11539]EPQ61350.1 hypothetical protein GLOTRDRAFT_69736 [Gloeophyllum trabeum ATCC 11539]